MPAKQEEARTTRHLPKSANTDPRTTHVAINKKHGDRFFCRFEEGNIHPQQDVPIEQVKGTYWVTPCKSYTRHYYGCSLWQGGFNFIPLEQYQG